MLLLGFWQTLYGAWGGFRTLEPLPGERMWLEDFKSATTLPALFGQGARNGTLSVAESPVPGAVLPNHAMLHSVHDMDGEPLVSYLRPWRGVDVVGDLPIDTQVRMHFRALVKPVGGARPEVRVHLFCKSGPTGILKTFKKKLPTTADWSSEQWQALQTGGICPLGTSTIGVRLTVDAPVGNAVVWDHLEVSRETITCSDSDAGGAAYPDGINPEIKGAVTSNWDGWDPDNPALDGCLIEDWNHPGAWNAISSCEGVGCVLNEYSCNTPHSYPVSTLLPTPLGCRNGVKVESRQPVGALNTMPILIVNSDDENNIDGNYPDIPSQFEAMRQAVFVELADFIARESYGKAWITGEPLGPYAITSAGICDLPTLGQQNEEFYQRAYAAVDRDIPPDARVVFFYDLPDQCVWSHTPKHILTFDQGIVRHEHGHSLSFQNVLVGHTVGYECVDAQGQRVLLDETCFASTRTDPYDIMSNHRVPGVGHSSMNKERYGWLSAGNFLITNSGTHTITPLEDDAEGLKVLKVPLPNLHDQLYIELRNRDRVIVHTVREQFQLGLVVPGPMLEDNYLKVGQPYAIQRAGITLTVDAVVPGVSATITLTTQGMTQCSDGIDNELSAAVPAYLFDAADFGCLTPYGNYDPALLSELHPMPQCGDGIDNDGDELIDGLDGGCENDEDNSE